jgi:uncharacterized protein (DUF697 family)
MKFRRDFWNKLKGHLLAPRVDDVEIAACLARVKSQLPVPVFWLLGKTQSGKTSLIRSMTGHTNAEIGDGIRPCTRTAQTYAFPAEADALFRFLDTRGLAEAGYDPAEDLAQFAGQAHLLIVVMKALDHAQQPVFDALEAIHKHRPDWPILVVQTCLHEGYLLRDAEHAQPYPFGTVPFPPSVPTDLSRSLLAQRELFSMRKMKARFVAVDFTLPEDGFDPSNYGRDELIAAIEELLPLGLQNILWQIESVRQDFRDVHFRAARPHVLWYSLAAGAAAGIPVPLVDLPLVVAVQAKMFHAISSIYRQPVSRERLGEILGALGLGVLGRWGGRELLKFIPGFGTAVSALYTAATTYALGQTLCAYFSRVREGAAPGSDELRKLYSEFFREGEATLRQYLQRATGSAASPPVSDSPPATEST